jgi:hypothetical protein
MWAVWTVTTTAITLPVLLFGLLFRVLISPEQVFASTLLVLILSLTLYIYITFCIDTLIDIKCCPFNPQLWSNQSKVFVALFKFGIFFGFFIIGFCIVYIQVILFSGVDNIGTVNIAADLLMLLLLAFIVWMIKKEYNKCKNNEEEKDETNDEVSGDVLPNTQPSRGGTANMTDNTPLIRSV